MKKNKVMTVSGSKRQLTNKERDKEWLRLLERSRDEDYYITSNISGVETIQGTDLAVAVVQLGGFKVMIPIGEAMVIEVDNNNSRSIEEQAKYFLGLRVGSEIDFLVDEIFEDEKIATASRLSAMKKRREQSFFQKDEDGHYTIDEGDLLEARVVAAFRTGIVVETFGVEARMLIRDLSYARIQSASDEFRVGSKIIVKVMGIDRNEETKDVDLRLSVKEVEPHPFDSHKLTEGGIYAGKISYIDVPEGKQPQVFVILDDGNTVLCLPPERADHIMPGLEVSLKVTTINEEYKRIFGTILRVEAL